MKVSSGTAWGIGKYTCDKCKTEQILLAEGDTLEQCSNCGGNSFDIQIKLSRSQSGLKNKLSETAVIIETSIFLYQECQFDEFLPVIAGQLRLLLCDTKNNKDNSLLPKVIDSPFFHPHQQNFITIRDSKMILEENLFDIRKEKIPLHEWQDQIIYSDTKSGQDLKIYSLIRAWADKNGGAHIDDQIPELDLIAIALFKGHLIRIAEYVLRFIGGNLQNDIQSIKARIRK